jgi:hypothetical protein
MTPIETSVSDATIWSLIVVINYGLRVARYAPRVISYAPGEHYSKGMTHDEHQMTDNMFMGEVTEVAISLEKYI